MGKKTHYVIYGLHKGDGVIRYVGRSIHGTNRLSYHRANARNNNTKMPVHKWMRSVGIDVVVMEILEECLTEAELPEREDFWIKELKTHVSDGGLNVAIGANGGYSGTPISDETRLKMKESAYKRLENESPEQREKRLAVLKKNAQAKPFLGKKHTKEAKERNRLSKLGKYDGVNNPNARLTEEQIEYIKSYPRYYGSIPFLMNELGISRSTVDRYRAKGEENDK